MADSKMQNWLDTHADVASVRPVIWDLNGIMRGKLLPRNMAGKAFKGEMKLPLSSLGVDVWGNDADESGQVLETGDVDGFCAPTGRGPLEIDWLDNRSSLLPVWMFRTDGRPFEACPRQVLNSVVDLYKQKGLTPVCASELEFYLYVRDEKGGVHAPDRLGGSDAVPASAMYSLADIDEMDGFIADVYAACEKWDIPADAAISEFGVGQMEINLNHVADPLKAADDAVLFKYLIKGIAKKHGLGATFMAKPYGGQSGNGMHFHFSMLDEKGENIFDNGTEEGSDALRHCVAGLLDTIGEFMPVFAPHFNSYRRIRPGTHAPTNIAWGYDNRTAPVRIPSGPNKSRRIEHRIAGADANPYLVMAAILAGSLHGLENKLTPPDAVEGDAYDMDLPSIPLQWRDAIDAMEQGEYAKHMFGELFYKMYVAAKNQEYDQFMNVVTRIEYETYLESV
ncbi:MAG: glutamine synthetase family protein [Litorimonas sp.]